MMDGKSSLFWQYSIFIAGKGKGGRSYTAPWPLQSPISTDKQESENYEPS